jgi:hypothetical protein
MPRRNIPDEHGVGLGFHLWFSDLASHLGGQLVGSADAGRLAALSPGYQKRLAAVLGD